VLITTMRPWHRSSRTDRPDGSGTSERSRYVISDVPRSRAEAIEQNAIAAKVEFYRNEAQRLLGLAASAIAGDAKAQFLALAQQYETLAEHAAERMRRLRS
jgi:hypothetical protein